MITLPDLRQRAQNRYETILRTYLTGANWTPLVIPANKTLDRHAGPEAIFAQQRDLLLHSKNKTGRGYTLDLKPNAKTGQSEIRRIAFDTLADYLFFIDKEAEFAAFEADVAQVRSALPALLPLLERSPRLVVEQAGNWPNLLLVATYFQQNPQPNQYVRNLPLALPTKFIENNRGILRQLLDHLLPNHLNAAETDFYKRFHLTVEEPLVKLRYLDERLRLHPALSHLSLWLSEFRQLHPPGRRVFIIENLTTFLSFPDVPDSLAIWGAGFAVMQLDGIDWLTTKDIHYWSDLDTQGFQLLDWCRRHYPQTRSLLMDRPTLDAHQAHLTPGDSKPVGELTTLTNEEQAVFQWLKTHNARIEQERLGVAWIWEGLEKISSIN